jgi:hypothetical protein
MPFNYKDVGQVRDRLLSKNAKWQAELDKLTKGTKDVTIKAVSQNIAEVADELVAVNTVQNDQIIKNHQLANKAVSASSAALESSSMALETQKIMAKDLKETESKVETNTKRSLKSIHERQRADLERSQTVVIARGIPSLVEGKESYNDLEAAVLTAFKKIGLKRGTISINYIRRMNQAGGERAKKDREPRALRVELSSIGDKIKLYEAMIETSSSKRVDFSLTSEIPKYALPKYRKLGKMAKALRDNDGRWKTKVSIPRGKLQPVLQLKKRGSGDKYKPATEAQLKQATDLWEKERKSREDGRLLEASDGDEEMDTDSTQRGNYMQLSSSLLSTARLHYISNILSYKAHTTISDLTSCTAIFINSCTIQVIVNNHAQDLLLPRLILALYCLLIRPPQISADLSKEGMPVILQSDIRTVIIRSNIENVTLKINEIDRAVSEMDGRTASLDMNRLGSRKDLDLLTRSVRPLHQISGQLRDQFNVILKGREKKERIDSGREKRAIEFIGSALNWISGVPTAEDHRKVLEQVNRIRLDEVTAVDELKHQNQITQQALKHMQIQETDISNLRQAISKLKISQYEGAGISIRTIAVLLVTNQVHQLAQSVRQDIRQIERVLDKSDSKMLARSAISVTALSEIIDRIFLESRNSTPVFQQGDCHYYYSLPLAHSWVSENEKFLMTLLQVPIAHVGQTNSLTVLDPLNKIFGDLPMAVVNTASNYFRYLSLSDVDNCHHLTSHLLCMKREIRIVPAHGCSMELANCKVWATHVVHDLTNTEIMLILSEEMTATMACDNKTDVSIELPLRSIMRLSINCRISTNSFIIQKVSYRHLADETVDSFKDNPIQILKDDELLRRKLNVHSDIPASEIPKLKTLIENNKDLMDQIKSNAARSQSLWQNISGGQTPIEQIITWSLLSLSLFLSIISVSFHIKGRCGRLSPKLQIKGRREKSEGAGVDGMEMGRLEQSTMELLQDVNQRLRNLETMQLRRPTRGSRLALTDSRMQEELDV